LTGVLLEALAALGEDPRKPALDLLRSRRTGQGEMQLDVGMFFQELPHLSRLVNGQVVEEMRTSSLGLQPPTVAKPWYT
jgi:hypothetical protein